MYFEFLEGRFPAKEKSPFCLFHGGMMGVEQRKGMGLWAAISIGVGGMVGAGIFSILGAASAIAGNALYVSFFIAGLVALLNAYSYAKLGVKYPTAGGPVEFLIRGFGNTILSGGLNILLWVGYIFALALYARAFGGYAVTFLPANSSSSWIGILGTGIVLLFVLLEFIGARAVAAFESVNEFIKITILTLFAVIGYFSIKPQLLSLTRWPGTSHILFGAALIFIAYEGFGLITNAAEDMRTPHKTLPKALYLSIAIVILLYVSVSMNVVGHLSVAQIVKAQDYALAQAAVPFLGRVGFVVIVITALLSTASAINATLYGGSNVSYMIARDGELPKVFERTVFREAKEGMLITAALVIVFLNTLPLDRIALLGSGAFLLIYGSVNVAHLKLYKETKAKPLLIWTAILGDLASFVVLTIYSLQKAPVTLWVLVGVVAFSFTLEWGYRTITRRDLKIRWVRRKN